MTNAKQDTEDYYICLDDRLDDKKVIRSFTKWENLFYKRFYPNYNGIVTKRMYFTFIEWHYINLIYRYTK